MAFMCILCQFQQRAGKKAEASVVIFLTRQSQKLDKNKLAPQLHPLHPYLIQCLFQNRIEIQ